MVLDRALTDAEVGGNVLARVTGEHEVHDLALAGGQARDGYGCRFPPRGKLRGVAGLLQGKLDSGEQILVAETGFSMKSATCVRPVRDVVANI